MVDDPQKMLGELARLGARLIIQRAVEDEFDQWLGRARYERRPEGPAKGDEVVALGHGRMLGTAATAVKRAAISH